MEWYRLTKEELFSNLESDEDGLDAISRQERLAKEGPNELSKGEEISEIRKFLSHFNDLLVYALIVSAALKGFIGDFIDMAIILFVVLVNALIGYIQEAKATDSLNSLSNMMSANAVIWTGNEKVTVDAASLVKGDIVFLKPGDIIPADLRLLDAYNLVVEEAILTGESTPVNKSTDIIESEADLGDRLNMVFSGTLVNAGSAKAVVVETGDRTEIGKISEHLKSVEDSETPLITKMKLMNKQIFAVVAGLIVFLVIFSFFYRDMTGDELLSAMIALAVSAIPEGLPAVLSIILSVGVTRMARQNAIIKKMPAVETLGSMEVICSDKTGTLTKNEMSVVAVITADDLFDTTDPNEHDNQINQTSSNQALTKMVETALYCNDTKVTYKGGVREIIGNPTEGALLDWANQMALTENVKEISKLPFDSAYKYMATLVDVEDKRYIYLKGAPDVLLDLVEKEVSHNQVKVFDESPWNEKIATNAKLGQRLLAAAYKEVSNTKETLTHEDISSDMILVGLFGIIDPPKKEAIEAVRVSRQAGISVKMITGDHKDTAMAIAKDIGIENYADALVGKDIEALSDEELEKVVMSTDVYARTTPEHKLRLVEAIQRNGQIVGMTGDGVNDAPALKQADIGIAMGIKGTEVTKDAADMVLSDDNFATITSAVKEGRRVYENLKKTIYFSLPTAFAQGLLVVV
ncbi:MAG: HAD-IC family P-type ATPase, partial [Lactococcus sp.]|nr:HAD-IC family P-type ATPase [Lactococcus sp.]